jgi:hypothetical protein
MFVRTWRSGGVVFLLGAVVFACHRSQLPGAGYAVLLRRVLLWCTITRSRASWKVCANATGVLSRGLARFVRSRSQAKLQRLSTVQRHAIGHVTSPRAGMSMR